MAVTIEFMNSLLQTCQPLLTTKKTYITCCLLSWLALFIRLAAFFALRSSQGTLVEHHETKKFSHEDLATLFWLPRLVVSEVITAKERGGVILPEDH